MSMYPFQEQFFFVFFLRNIALRIRRFQLKSKLFGIKG